MYVSYKQKDPENLKVKGIEKHMPNKYQESSCLLY